VFAPSPSAIVITTIAENAGATRIARNAYFRSCINIFDSDYCGADRVVHISGRFTTDRQKTVAPENNGYLLQRLSAYIDFHVNGRVRFFAQPMSATAVRRQGGPRPVIHESKLFFQQAFADITVAAEKENSPVMRRTVAGARVKYRDGSLVD
jgi:hypothetical protein